MTDTYFVGKPKAPPAYVPPVFPPADFLLPTSRGFRPAKGVITSHFSSSPLRSIKKPGASTPAQKAGKRYEAKLYKQLEKLEKSGSRVKPLLGPWIAYEDESGSRHCQPDALLVSDSEIWICEIKLTHTANAYWQLRYLYEPVVRKLYEDRPIRLCEITRSFDPAVKFGEEMRLFFSLEDLLASEPSNALEVLQWKL